MKFSGYLFLKEDTSVIDFGPDRLIPLAGHAPKVGHNELDCSIELNFWSMFANMGHCVVSIFKAVRPTVYKIIQ